MRELYQDVFSSNQLHSHKETSERILSIFKLIRKHMSNCLAPECECRKLDIIKLEY